MNDRLFTIINLRVEYMERPLGLDVKLPRFSWEMESEVPGCGQSAYRIVVTEIEEGIICYDTGKQHSKKSNELLYAGTPLKTCTKYLVAVTVWAHDDMDVTAQTWFETGLMNPAITAWDGAKWIGAPKYSLDASRRGVFVLETEFRIEEGSSRAGLVFGANDTRLKESTQNEYFLAGENYICYEIDISEMPAKLNIYRVGYHPTDMKDQPLISIPVIGLDSGDAVITKENRHDFHLLTIEVTGNCAFAYLDGILVDGEDKEQFGQIMRMPRQLNPRGNNDVITYPRLYEIGFWAGHDDTAYFNRIEVRNLRKPGAVIFQETATRTLYETESIYQKFIDSGDIEIVNQMFCIKGKEKNMPLTADPSYGSIPMFRRKIQVNPEQKIVKARLYASSRGIYEVSLNGLIVSSDLFPPGNTQYDKHLLYQTYDITDFLQSGENVIGFILASGWWSDAQTFVLQNYNYWGDKESFLCKAVIYYEDGSKKIFTSNPDDWTCSCNGPWRYAGFFSGEFYDARKENIKTDFTKAGFDDSSWEVPIEISPVFIPAFHSMPKGFGREWPEVNAAEPEMVGHYQASVREVLRKKAISREEIFDGVFIYDFGQEMAGMPEIRFQEDAGTEIMLRYSEMKYPNLSEYGELAGTLLFENYRDATSTDIYICQGKESGEVYCPRFTFHGYRYLELRGVKNPPTLDEVFSVQISSIHKITSKFACSNPLVNRFVENVDWSQLCNFISIPTDCPQRNERMGWAGDTHAFIRTALMSSDARLFYYRNLQAMKDLQIPSGQYPNIAPVGGGFGGITYESASFLMAWELYQQYHDKHIVAEHYESLKLYLNYLEQKGMPGDIYVGPLGDWLAQEETDVYLLWNAFYAYDLVLMTKFAQITKQEEDVKYYQKLRDHTIEYWNQTFVDPQSHMTRNRDGSTCDTQCSYALPLLFGIFLPEYSKSAGEHLNRRVCDSDYKVMTGFFGTGALNEALTKAGYPETAYRLMEQTEFPSWLYSVTQGATTIWERWNSFTVAGGFGGNNSMNSFNHYSLGSVKSWLLRDVLGIQTMEEEPGYQKFILKPLPMVFEWAEGSIQTVYGTIESSWNICGKTVEYQCKVPANTEAVLMLPGREEQHLCSGYHMIKCDI